MGSHGGWLGKLRGTAQDIWGLGIGELNREELRYYVDSVSGTMSLLELVRVRAMKALEDASAHDMTGAADITAFFSQECGLTPEAVNERLTVARQMSLLSSTVDKVASGEITFDTATVVAHNTAKMGEEQKGVVETDILEASKSTPPGLLR